jgi:DNA-binding beta-propeller fold protein YncE
MDVRGRALASVAVIPLLWLTACGRSDLPASQSHVGPGTSVVPNAPKGPPPPVTTTTRPPVVPLTWPEHTLASVPVPSFVTVNPAGNDAYALVSETTTPERGPYRLERTDLVDHSVTSGPLFSQSDLALLAGDLWVFGAVDRVSGEPASAAEVSEVDPGTLLVIRTLALPAARPADGTMALTDGPAGSIWIGYSQSLVRVDATTGAVLDRITVPSGLVVSDVAVDPAGQFLYVSYAHNVGGPSVGAQEGAVVYEYDASSGGDVADTMTGPVTDSVAGASLVAVPLCVNLQ